MKPLLKVSNLVVKFGGIVALHDISFQLSQGEVLGLVGPNGAGKTTLFNCLNRIYSPSSGELLLGDVSLLDYPVHKIAQLGIARTFQNVALFPRMTVLENVMTGVHAKSASAFFKDIFYIPWLTKSENSARDIAMDLISFLDLDIYALRPAGGLPYGILKKVELARALAAKPKLLLLDEPAGGLSQAEVEDLKERLFRIKAEGTVTQILVEHNVPLVMELCSRVVVLDAGKKIAEDVPEKVRENKEVIAAYLGGSEL